MTSIEEISGISPVHAAWLRDAGILSAEDLLKRGSTREGRMELAAKAGVSEKLILSWVNHADLSRIKAVAAEFTELLEAAGVHSVPDLAQWDAVDLRTRIISVNEQDRITPRIPTARQVQEWVAEARTMSHAHDSLPDTAVPPPAEQRSGEDGPATESATQSNRAHGEGIPLVEAARLLGLRSVPMVGRWVREGLLDGFLVGGAVMVSQASVERMLTSATLAEELAYERDLDEVLEAFDAGDEPLAPSSASSSGRAPWDGVAARRR
jgi:hypothetical protein